MTIPAFGRFDFNRAELWADGVVHVLGIALGLGAVTALIAQGLVARGEVRGFSVVVLGPVDPEGGRVTGVRTSPGVSSASIPPRLRRAVESSSRTAWTYTRLQRLSDDAGEGTPAVAVGSMAQVKIHCRSETCLRWAWRTINDVFNLRLL